MGIPSDEGMFSRKYHSHIKHLSCRQTYLVIGIDQFDVELELTKWK